MLLKPLRSLLFLPATESRLLDKAHQRGADALIVDLEDAVLPHRKAEARPMAGHAVRMLHERGVTVLVRVNSEPELHEADLAALPLDLVSALMLPKVESPEQVRRFAGLHDRPMAALIESPRGVLNALQVAESHERLCALVFGSEDHAAAMGVAPVPAALTWPASMVVTAAHACGLQCWGLAASVAIVDDEAAYASAVGAARMLGFTGAVCIHPRQVAAVNLGFRPGEQELAWAARVVAADAQAREQGAGAALVDGRMIDRPVVERARRLLG